MYFLRRLRKFGMPPYILHNFNRCTVESVLTCCIAVWFGNSTAHDRKTLQRVIKLAQKNHRGRSPSLQDTYKWACNIISNPIHSTQNFFTLVKSGKWYWSTAARTFRLRKFFSLALFPSGFYMLHT